MSFAMWTLISPVSMFSLTTMCSLGSCVEREISRACQTAAHDASAATAANAALATAAHWRTSLSAMATRA
jgi:hypothetical protein